MVGDLQQLVNRACHFSACRGIQASESSSLPAMNPGASSFADQEHLECRVASVDFTEAMSSFVPALHQGVQSVRTEPTSFDDIGGLEDAKRSLNQALQLPAKVSACTWTRFALKSCALSCLLLCCPHLCAHTRVHAHTHTHTHLYLYLPIA